MWWRLIYRWCDKDLENTFELAAAVSASYWHSEICHFILLNPVKINGIWKNRVYSRFTVLARQTNENVEKSISWRTLWKQNLNASSKSSCFINRLIVLHYATVRNVRILWWTTIKSTVKMCNFPILKLTGSTSLFKTRLKTTLNKI